jgi:hypothetical protein
MAADDDPGFALVEAAGDQESPAVAKSSHVGFMSSMRSTFFGRR